MQGNAAAAASVLPAKSYCKAMPLSLSHLRSRSSSVACHTHMCSDLVSLGYHGAVVAMYKKKCYALMCVLIKKR